MKSIFRSVFKIKQPLQILHHILKKALERALKEHEQGIKKEKSALDNFAGKYVIDGESGVIPIQFFKNKSTSLKDFFRSHRIIKTRLVLTYLMEQKLIDEIKTIFIQDRGYFHSETHILLEATDVKELLSKMIYEILNKIGIYQKNGSGWYSKEVLNLEIHTVDYKPMKRSSYIPLPDFISNKKAIKNIQNKDQKCFLWCILRYLHPAKNHNNRLTDLKQYKNDLNFKNVDFPVKLKDIKKFENQNPSVPGINVFSLNDNNKSYPLRMTQKDCEETVDSFLFEKDGKSHYSFISSFNRLFRPQITSRTNNITHICKKCFTHFTKQELFEKHSRYCSTNETVAEKMPARNTTLKFQNYYKQLPMPYVVYADFECFTKQLETCEPYPHDSYTYSYQKHEPSGLCLYLKGLDGINKLFNPIIYTKQSGPKDEDIASIFGSKFKAITKQIYNDYYKNPKPLKLTTKEQEEFDKAEICHVCNKEFKGTQTLHKVRDHCDFAGKYRGAAHNSCNLHCRKPMILPFIFHNLQGYGSHLFIKQLAKLTGELTCIPSTEEKYISFSKKIKVDEYKSKKTGETFSLNFEIRFIGSFKFLQTSLANLVSNFQSSDFQNTKPIIKDNVGILTEKEVYPYDYVSSVEKFSETQLPPKSEFYSKLNDEVISDSDYPHAFNVWNTFNCKTIRDYHDLYLKSDVLLLADVFENFRKTCLKCYNLDSVHYFTSPGLAWDACLKETGQELELLHDYDMLMLFEKGIRGGITHISKRFAKANNKYMSDYNPDKPSKCIQYLDANNLYG